MESVVKTIAWNEIESTATQVFDLWVNKSPEIIWAKTSWEILSVAGLTTYSSEIERCEKLIYFLALAGIYRDFWCLAADECVEIEYKELANSLGIELKALNKEQLLHYIDLITEKYDDTNTYNFFSNCFRELANEHRKDVYSALLNGHGGDEGKLFISLWRSCESSPEYEFSDDEDIEDENFHETDEYILNNSTPEKSKAYQWITEGCYPYNV